MGNRISSRGLNVNEFRGQAEEERGETDPRVGWRGR